MKEKMILLGYCLPWAFLAMYGDMVHDTLFFYTVMLAGMMGLGLVCRKSGCVRLGFWGNALSLGISLACLWLIGAQDWNPYFKPFSVMGMAAALSCLSFVIQYLIWYWKRERDAVQNFLVALFSAALGLGALVLVILFLVAREIGAV